MLQHSPIVFVTFLISLQLSNSQNGQYSQEHFTKDMFLPTNTRNASPNNDNFNSEIGTRANMNSEWNNLSEEPVQKQMNSNIGGKLRNANVRLIPNWPDPKKQLGQVSAVSFDTNGNVVVFHRGDHVWGATTFLRDNVYNQKELGPITQNTVVVFNSSSGSVLHEWGSNMFYMPHGLTIDSDGNIWITDVGLHQVFKFSANESLHTKPVLTLGTRFVPGNDNTHFCKPTDVAISSTGDFFVSDGYCNSRIIKYSKTGQKLLQWGRSTLQGFLPTTVVHPYHFFVPHALVLAEDKDMLCVADRENGRIPCFNCHNGSFIMQLKSHYMGSRIFSIAYSTQNGGLLYAVNGPEFQTNMVPIQGFVLSISTLQTLASFGTFENPHDIAISGDGNQIVVVELNPYKVWKFDKVGYNSSNPVAKKSGEEPSITTSIPSITVNISNKALAPNPLHSVVDKKSISHSRLASSIPALGVTLSAVAVIGVVVMAAVLRMRGGGSGKRRDNPEYRKMLNTT